ncbi:cytochrome P450, partial [Sarocladium strictum]
VPGPWYAKFTTLYLKLQVLSGRRMFYIHDLHRRYGPVVRVSPGEVDVLDQEAFKTIHRIGGGFVKDKWYSTFRVGEAEDVFSMLDPAKHARRRRLLAPLFSNSAILKNWYPVITEKIGLTITNIKGEAREAGEVDIFKWWTFMTADVISHLAFGEPFGMVAAQKKTYHMQKIEDAGKFGLICSELPWLRTLVNWIPLRSIQEMDADDVVQRLAEDTMKRSREAGIGSTNLFSKIVAESEKDKTALTDYEVAFEAGGLTVAGSGTTAVTLSYLVWAVLSHPEIQRRLEDEVCSLQPWFGDSDLERLPYLSAVIAETLRLYSAAPGALPRRMIDNAVTLAGYVIPPGVTISTQAYSYHRDSSVFPVPERFEPERFLDSDGAFQPIRSGAYFPFGAGSRSCLGIHLAYIELRHAVAAFFRECKGARLSPRTTPQSMEMANFFLVVPKAEACFIQIPSDKSAH